MVLYQEVKGLACFDLVPQIIQFVPKQLRFDLFEQAKLSFDILPQHQDLGYKTHNAVENIGSLIVPLLVLFMMLFVLTVAFLLKVFCIHKVKKKIDLKVLERYTWFPLLWFIVACFVPLSIACWLQIKDPVFTQKSEQFAMFPAAIIIVLLGVVLPLALLATWILPGRVFLKESVNRRLGYMVS